MRIRVDPLDCFPPDSVEALLQRYVWLQVT